MQDPSAGVGDIGGYDGQVIPATERRNWLWCGEPGNHCGAQQGTVATQVSATSVRTPTVPIARLPPIAPPGSTGFRLVHRWRLLRYGCADRVIRAKVLNPKNRWFAAGACVCGVSAAVGPCIEAHWAWLVPGVCGVRVPPEAVSKPTCSAGVWGAGRGPPWLDTRLRRYSPAAGGRWSAYSSRGGACQVDSGRSRIETLPRSAPVVPSPSDGRGAGRGPPCDTRRSPRRVGAGAPTHPAAGWSTAGDRAYRRRGVRRRRPGPSVAAGIVPQVHRRLPPPRPAGGLGFVQSHIRARDRVVDRAAARRHPDTHRDAPADSPAPSNAATDARIRLATASGLSPVSAPSSRAELVAAVPHEQIVAADLRPDHLGDQAQDRVAGMVTQFVVDRLEPVQGRS